MFILYKTGVLQAPLRFTGNVARRVVPALFIRDPSHHPPPTTAHSHRHRHPISPPPTHQHPTQHPPQPSTAPRSTHWHTRSTNISTSSAQRQARKQRRGRRPLRQATGDQGAVALLEKNPWLVVALSVAALPTAIAALPAALPSASLPPEANSCSANFPKGLTA